MSRWRRLFTPGDPVEPPSAASPPDELAAIRQQLDTVIHRVRSSSGRIPPAAVMRARDIGDEVAQLVRELDRRRRSGSSIDALVVATLESTVNDYLPTSVDSFLAVTDQGGIGGDAARRGAEDQLYSQLELLSSGMQELVDSVRSGTANPLDVQGRFLEAKFGKNDLRL